MTKGPSVDDFYWEEFLRVEDLSDEELQERRKTLATIVQRAEAELNRLLDAAVAAGRMSPQDAANDRAAFEARMQDGERQLSVIRERAKMIIKGPKEPT